MNECVLVTKIPHRIVCIEIHWPLDTILKFNLSARHRDLQQKQMEKERKSKRILPRNRYHAISIEFPALNTLILSPAVNDLSISSLSIQTNIFGL